MNYQRISGNNDGDWCHYWWAAPCPLSALSVSRAVLTGKSGSFPGREGWLNLFQRVGTSNLNVVTNKSSKHNWEQIQKAYSSVSLMYWLWLEWVDFHCSIQTCDKVILEIRAIVELDGLFHVPSLIGSYVSMENRFQRTQDLHSCGWTGNCTQVAWWKDLETAWILEIQ